MTASALVGTILSSRYRIVRLIGEGGMGAVYEAQHVHLGKRVVVKTLLDDLACDPMARKRFRREAWATARIEHPNIVRVTDVDVHEERLAYFVMEYLPGEDLSQTLSREGRLPWQRVRRIGLQICSALAASHAQKVIHRDLKPSNCFRVVSDAAGDEIKILDFGIAKIAEPALTQSGHCVKTGAFNSLRQRLTQGGEVFGTVVYMSPEHILGHEVDHRTDIYAVGVILYQLLTDQLPIPFENHNNLLHFTQSLVQEVPRAPSACAPDAGIPPEFDRVIARALEKWPEHRFASMQEMLAALQAIEGPAELASAESSDRRGEDAPTSVQARSSVREVVCSASMWRRCALAGLMALGSLFCLGGWLSPTADDGASMSAPPASGPVASSMSQVTPPELRLDPVESLPRTTAPARNLVRSLHASPPAAAPEPAHERGADRHPVPRPPRRCDLDPYDRHRVVQPYRAQVAARCRAGLAADVRVPVAMRIRAGKIMFKPKSGLTKQQRAAAECAANYLGGRARPPPRYMSCETSWVVVKL